jgi:hypothetical protein
MPITVVSGDKVHGLLARLPPLRAETSGVMFISDTYLSRPEYFR